MKRFRSSCIALFATLVLGGNPSCNAIANIFEGLPRVHGTTCSTIDDCTVEFPDCREAVACEQRTCVFVDAIEGTALAQQTPGDCVQVQCDGLGKTRTIVVPTDFDDGDPCTEDACDGPTPVHMPKSHFPCYDGPPGTKGKGACVEGVQACDPQGKPIGGCVGQVLPIEETCYTPEDDDCNGQTNEGGLGCICEPSQVLPCYSGPAGTENQGVCHGGTMVCHGGLVLGPCEGERTPSIETCDADQLDEDCDGLANEEGADCFCGDGYVSSLLGEACDDGNVEPDDGCSETCQEYICGNGFVQTGELCDDGNTVNGDGCPAMCRHLATTVVIGRNLGHSCVILDDARVKCWGQNNYGELGLGDQQHRGDAPFEMGNNLPAVDLGTDMVPVALSAGGIHTCALSTTGRVKCWGRNAVGQLGLGDNTHRGTMPGQMGDNLPAVDLGTMKWATAITAGWGHTCAILNDETVKCWGANDVGQLGLGDTLRRGDEPNEMGDALPAVDLGTGKRAVELSLGAGFTCALLNDGNVKCWGDNGVGQLGLGDTSHRGDEPNEMGDALPAVDLGAGKPAVAVVAGLEHACALLNDGTVKCWGGNMYGQLGRGDVMNRGDEPLEMGDNLPTVDLGLDQKAKNISTFVSTCVVLLDGRVKCWGRNLGLLGIGDAFDRGDQPNEMGDNLPFVNLGTGATVASVAVGGCACALLTTGDLKCWGPNYYGQLGLGDKETRGDEAGEMGNQLPHILF